MARPIYIFAGGGTGGHLYPALAVAEELVRSQPGAEIVFACSDRAIDRQILEPRPYAFVPQPVRPLPRRIGELWRFVRTYAASARQARQMVRHGHWTVNGRRVDIPSYQVREGDIVAVKAGTPAENVIRDATELTAQVPAWLQADHDALTAKVLRKPERKEIAAPVQEQLIVELYSK